jgi:hypothetical protein
MWRRAVYTAFAPPYIYPGVGGTSLGESRSRCCWLSYVKLSNFNPDDVTHLDSSGRLIAQEVHQ